MSDNFAHLLPTVGPIAEESAEARIRRIRTDRWISYARAEAALAALEDLLSFPQRTRMPNLLLVGATNNGKTMIVEKFKRGYPRLDPAPGSDGVANISVVKMQMPPAPDERRFFSAIMESLCVPYATGEAGTTVRFMRAVGARMLVIDELHNILSGSRDRQRRLLNALRWIGNELQIPLVGVGTAEALQAIRSDDQLVNRFEPFPLPLWTDNEAYRRLLATLEAVLPLRRPSGLARPKLASKIISAAEGVLGEIIAVVTRAAVLAVQTGAESISVKLIDQAGFVPPSERRRVAV